MITIRDISEARRDDIEALGYPRNQGQIDVLVAVAEQLDMFAFRAVGRTEITQEWSDYQAALQIWEAAFEAAGGVVQSET